MIVIGLTGSIGMGKSTAARIFKDHGFPVHDADTAVHTLLDWDGYAVSKIASLFPDSLEKNNHGQKRIDRKKLGKLVFGNQTALKKLESILHPMVREKSDKFIQTHRNQQTEIIVLDIPLLFETRGEHRVDCIVVVTANPETQKKRVMERSGMTEERFNAIVAQQMPDHEKQAKADYIIRMDQGIEQAEKDINDLIEQIKKDHANA